MSEKDYKYGISTESGMFGKLNLKDDPSFIEVEEDDSVDKAIKDAIKKNKQNLSGMEKK